jgi:DNA-binding PadR family transcriptional regulator
MIGRHLYYVLRYNAVRNTVELVTAKLGRYSEPALLVLISLSGGDRHGYAISEDIGKLTGQRPGPGTLYGALSRLDAAGLVEALPGERRRRPYRITPDGVRFLQAETQRLSALTAEVSRRLQLRAAR